MENITQLNFLPVAIDAFDEYEYLTMKIARRDPISNEALRLVHLVMTGIWYLICLTGISTNVINVRTFVKIGVEDSVTVSLLALAISDFNLCTVALLELTSFLVDLIGKEYNLFFYIPPLMTGFYFMCFRKIFTTSTVIITTFLAIQRCICVALPFYVKMIFNRYRTICFLVCMISVDVIIHLLFLSQHPAYVFTDTNTNVTQIQLNVPTSSEPIPFMVEIVIGIGLNIGCQMLVILCLIIMGVMLKRSVQFKKSAQVYTSNKDKSSADKGNAKERQALIQVGLVSIIFVTCNLPLLAYGIVNLTVPEFDFNGGFHNLYHLFHNIMFTAELINSSVNLFVYVKYNTKFRKACFIFKKNHAVSK